MSLFRKWNEISLIVRIICGLILGALLGLLLPGQEWIAIFGELFVGALKAMATSI